MTEYEKSLALLSPKPDAFVKGLHEKAKRFPGYRRVDAEHLSRVFREPKGKFKRRNPPNEKLEERFWEMFRNRHFPEIELKEVKPAKAPDLLN